MKTSNIVKILASAIFIFSLTNCNLFGPLDGSGSSTSSATISSENNEEAMLSVAIDALNSTTSDSSSEGSSAFSTSGSTKTSLKGGVVHLRHRCEDPSSVTESFSGNDDNDDEDAGTATHTITFEDCELEHNDREAVLNGSFTNTFTNAGEGFLNADFTIDLAKAVMGRDGEDAVHTHDTDDGGMVTTFTDKRDNEVTLTRTASRTETYTDPVDEDGDGSSEEVTATVEKTVTHTAEIGGETAHSTTVFTTDEEFEVFTEDEETEERTSETIAPQLPVHTITFDEDTGRIDSREISGNLIVDHNLAGLRMVITFEDLLHDDGTTCGPVSGSWAIEVYELDDDGNYVFAGDGEVEFEDGDVVSASYDGIALDPQPRPCS